MKTKAAIPGSDREERSGRFPGSPENAPENASEHAAAARQIERQQAEASRLQRDGLYDPSQEHASCGVGMIVSTDGSRRREIVTLANEALASLWHRGAVDADGKTGDGAGIHFRIPAGFFFDYLHRTGRVFDQNEPLGVGMIFLPRQDFQAQERARTLVETKIVQAGYRVHGWRQVPIRPDAVGAKANGTRPEIMQIIIRNRPSQAEEAFEKDLWLVRRRIEKEVLAEGIQGFYICSLSCRSLVYKGLFLAEQLTHFYPDLLDERMISDFAIYHQRYSTNTFPTWSLSQPFRILSHNGEINTISGNTRWMGSYESRLRETIPGEDLVRDIVPIIPHGSSDAGALDASFELLLRTGHTLPEVKSIMIPEAWEETAGLDPRLRDFYDQAARRMGPWDGPAAICAFDGAWVLAGMDRNGLRPLRFCLTKDQLLVVGSETGMVRLDESDITQKGTVGPGQMLGVHLEEGGFYDDAALKQFVATHHTTPRSRSQSVPFASPPEATGPTNPATSLTTSLAGAQRTRLQKAAGWTLEDVDLVLAPMGETGLEPTGSMGDDSPLAVLAPGYRPLHHFFRQNFSQVTNPPIDSLRERFVMSLKTRFGGINGTLMAESHAAQDTGLTRGAPQTEAPTETQTEITSPSPGNTTGDRPESLSESPRGKDSPEAFYHLDSPILLTQAFESLYKTLEAEAFWLDCTVPREDLAAGPDALDEAIQLVAEQALDAVHAGRVHLFLSDRALSAERVALPMILVAGLVHTRLHAHKLRTFATIHVQLAEGYDVHYAAVLIGCGTTSVNAWLAQETLLARLEQGLTKEKNAQTLLANYQKSVEKGLLKIMSKMGIAVLSSYRGGYNFEIIGLARALVHDFFPGVPSCVSGIGLAGLQQKLLALHDEVWAEAPAATEAAAAAAPTLLPVGSFFRARHGQEPHGWDGQAIRLLQDALAKESYQLYKHYSAQLKQLPPTTIRDLFSFYTKKVRPLDVEDTESVTAIRKRMVAPGISLGALSLEAHETIAIAMNRIGARSDSGEGGEDASRYVPRTNGDNASSAIKQIASGRFGVTAEYLNNCREIEIKMAQGAKPGEGGQLPGFKVSPLIARLRHSTIGTTLISPPPHHDIYSIEDLAQLIYDLKQINPVAQVCVKLVARSGIGTIAAGVAKAHADIILVSGHSGGTGASPQSSIKFAGLPWEIGLAETHQVLSMNGLRNKVRLRTDGGLKSGRDVVIAALLGADEYGIGTASLVAMGCLMVRQCHSNTCPVGICTQDEKLREKFTGTPEKITRLFTFIAEEIREILAELGAQNLDEIVGRTDLLRQIARGSPFLDALDLNPLLIRVEDAPLVPYPQRSQQRNEVADSLDAQIIRDASPLFEVREKMELVYRVQNTHRTVGARVSSAIIRRFGPQGLPPGHLTLQLRGSAGQSLGAFGAKGLTIIVKGDANDYVGKGLSGATLILHPPRRSMLETQQNHIMGNTVLYGATSGELYAAGRAGERLAVRNSGALCVAEGCGANGCEYMTGGRVVLLGKTGPNFGAGMTGGMAFVYDPDAHFPARINPETIQVFRLTDTQHHPAWEEELRSLVQRHADLTHSAFAQQLLLRWEQTREKFWQVIPIEILTRLDQFLGDSNTAA